MEFEWKVVDEHHQEIFVEKHVRGLFIEKHVRGLLWITSAGFSFWHSYPNPAVDLSHVKSVDEARKAVEAALCLEEYSAPSANNGH